MPCRGSCGALPTSELIPRTGLTQRGGGAKPSDTGSNIGSVDWLSQFNHLVSVSRIVAYAVWGGVR